MRYTAQDIFDSAIKKIDEQNESTGATVTADTKPYLVRTVSLLNGLIPEVYPFSDTYTPSGEGKRPVCPLPTELTDELDLDQFLCTAVLPWGLAALFVLDDDKAKADFFWQRFEEMKAEAKRTLPAETSSIEDVYGGIEHGEFGAWL